MFEMTCPPGGRMPVPHYHRDWDETIYGLSGVVTFTVDGKQVEIGPGDTVFIRRGVVHGFDNRSAASARCLCVLTPGVLGPEYFREIGAELAADTPPDPAKLRTIMERHGLFLRCPANDPAAGKYRPKPGCGRPSRSRRPQPTSITTRPVPERLRSRMNPIISIRNLSKTYASGFQALKRVSLDIDRGEIFALLGPNGAGKTTLIGIVCGIVNAPAGTVTVDGHDVVRDYRAARSLIGLVPQELTTDAFETVWGTVSFSRGLWGKPADPDHIAKVLKALSLWDRKDSKIFTLSGGMKRRVLIAKALSHEPRILFLDEPTAGVDVELRKDMWEIVRSLRASGVTIILTTHYIEEAEQIADRVGVINQGEIILVEDKAELMRKLGRKRLTLHLLARLDGVPPSLAGYRLSLAGGGSELVYTYDTQSERTGITALLSDLAAAGIRFRDLHTTQDSLEDIFVDLVRRRP
jgi:ABC-2 type transport system ATP-binding protein